MREILFRGKRLDNVEWVEGSFLEVTINGKTAHLIFGDNFAFVDGDVKALSHALVAPETVGQYTGLTDKNGKKIFEGDVGTGRNMLHPQRNKYEVVYEDNGFYFCDEKGVTWHPEHIDYFEIVGNIHDNSELLEVSHE